MVYLTGNVVFKVGLVCRKKYTESDKTNILGILLGNHPFIFCLTRVESQSQDKNKTYLIIKQHFLTKLIIFLKILTEIDDFMLADYQP